MICDKIELTPEQYGQKWVILGKSGSGKSYSARVLVEDGIKKGVTFTIIDPQSAYENIPNFYYVWAKKVTRAKDLGILLASTSKNTVISTKGLTIGEQNKFLNEFLEGFRKYSKKGIRAILIDECHKFAPESRKTESKEEVISMAQENRSDGLGFIAVEQRSQRLDKTILSQADYLLIHRLTSYRDLEAVKPYLDNPDDILKIKKLETGVAYFNGIKEDPFISRVRKAETEHSGNAPKNLLNEDTLNFNKHIGKLYKTKNGGQTMAEKDLVNGVVPSLDGFMDLVAKGAKMSIGMAAAGFVGAYASRIKSPVPFVSSRTLASGLTTVVLYAGYRKIPNAAVKDVLGYAAAGAAVHTAGSLVFDILAATKIQVPSIVNFALVTATGVPPAQAEGSTAAPGEGNVDLNTRFA